MRNSRNGSVDTMVSVESMRNRKTYVMMSACASAAMLMCIYVMSGMDMMIRLIPLGVVVPLTVFVMTAEKKDRKRNPKRLMNETPAVIGMMAVRLSAGGSLDTAVRDVAANGPRLMAGLFTEVVRKTDLRMVSGIKDGMNKMMLGLHKDMAAFRRSMMMLISASEAKNESERKRMIADAESTALTGLREMSETYSSSLNSPCMLIFGLGVMVPMILMSVLPMLSIGGMFSVTALNSSSVSFITLVAIPGIVAVVVASVLGNNPFMEGHGRKDEMKYILPLFASVPAFIVSFLVLNDAVTSILVAGLVAGAAGFVTVNPKATAEKKRARTEEAFDHMLFEIGNRLLAGENFETAMIGSLQSRDDRMCLATVFERTLVLSKGDVRGTVTSLISPYSDRCTDMYLRIYESSLGDPREAGRLAISLGHQVQDQATVKKSIAAKLKGMTDMMTGTSMFFAPLIMGLSLVILKPLSSISGAVIGPEMTITLMVYLIELALLISVLTVYLGNRGCVANVVHRFSMMLPIALIVFTGFSMVNI